ncbi:MAG: hypothetical protein CMK92_04720 [Pseudomonas sp.]|nr:hypothetical protein [Pseudomonas sp.]|tara:strand:+ start:57 stop:1313 length:1257 start_codon:yes stop_codon:yes gene_type:complete
MDLDTLLGGFDTVVIHSVPEQQTEEGKNDPTNPSIDGNNDFSDCDQKMAPELESQIVVDTTEVESDVCESCHIKLNVIDMQMRCSNCGFVSSTYSETSTFDIPAVTSAGLVSNGSLKRNPTTRDSKSNGGVKMFITAQKSSVVAQQHHLNVAIMKIRKSDLFDSVPKDQVDTLIQKVCREADIIQQNVSYTCRDNTNTGVIGAILYSMAIDARIMINHKDVAKALGITAQQVSTGTSIYARHSRKKSAGNGCHSGDLKTYQNYAKKYINRMIKKLGVPELLSTRSRKSLKPPKDPSTVNTDKFDPKFVHPDKMIEIVADLVNVIILSKANMMMPYQVPTLVSHILWFVCENVRGWKRYTNFGSGTYSKICDISRTAHTSKIQEIMRTYRNLPMRIFKHHNLPIPETWTAKKTVVKMRR